MHYYRENNKDGNVLGEIIIPFFPMNIFDEYLDTYKSFQLDDLIHVLIIFNIANRVYVYIELFSTFKFYVLVSDSYKGSSVYSNYCQKVIKNDFNEDNVRQLLKITHYEDAFIISSHHGIELSKNGENMEQSCKRIEEEAFNIIRKKAYEIDYLDYILDKNSGVISNIISKEDNDISKYCIYALQYLCNEEVDYDGNVIKNECIDNRIFRIYNVVICNSSCRLEEYPELLKKEFKISNNRYNNYIQYNLNKLSKLIQCKEIKLKDKY